jgi:site-specific DNA recombinase
MEDLLPNTNHTGNGGVKQSLIAGLYARVSTGRQEQEATIESQIDETKCRIEADGNILSQKHIFLDNGWTGTMLARPGLDALRDSIKRQEIQVLYVYDIGRLSRDFTYQLVLLREFEEAGIKVISLHDINPINEEQGLMRNVLGCFHDYERVKIAERFRRGKLYKAKNGVVISGSALYGYNYVKRTDTTPAHWERNEEEIRTIKLVFDWFVIERVSINGIIRRLYDLGIKPRKRRSDFWTKGSITRMLRCETYWTGIAYYNKHEAVESKTRIKNDKYRKVKKNSRRLRPKEEWYPFKVPIIMEDRFLYDKAQEIMEYNRRYAKKHRKFDYLLSEVLWCGCGNRRAGDGCNRNGHYYYRCEERLHHFPKEQRRCHIGGVNARVLDALVWKELTNHLTNSELLKKHAEEWIREQANRSADTQERLKIQEQIDKLTEEINRYAKAYGSGVMEFDQYMELVRAARRKKEGYQRQLEELKARVSPEVVNIEADELCAEARKTLKSLKLYDKKNFIRDIIEKVIIKERSEVEVLCHIPLPQLALTSTEKLGHEPIGRDCWSAKCGEVHSF